MATIKETIIRDGETINIYESGAEYSVTRRQLVKAPPSAMITKETSATMRKKRQEKTERLLREAITAETIDALDVPGTGPAAAVAAAGGILWREIVLNKEAYARDRIQAYERLTERAGMSNDGKRQDAEKNETGGLTGAVNELAAILREAMRPREAIDADVTDIRNDLRLDTALDAESDISASNNEDGN